MPVAGFGQAGKFTESGGPRWKIENEGFHTQKNLGYNLEQRYNRVNYNTVKNYYKCMQIVHLIEQLFTLSVMTFRLKSINIITI